jgi:hypothetical protein
MGEKDPRVSLGACYFAGETVSVMICNIVGFLERFNALY